MNPPRREPRPVDDWPFDDPPNVPVITTGRVISGDRPILYVCHDVGDGGWQFHTGEAVTEADAKFVPLRSVVNGDGSIRQLADLPPGGLPPGPARRRSGGDGAGRPRGEGPPSGRCWGTRCPSSSSPDDIGPEAAIREASRTNDMASIADWVILPTFAVVVIFGTAAGVVLGWTYSAVRRKLSGRRRIGRS